MEVEKGQQENITYIHGQCTKTIVVCGRVVESDKRIVPNYRPWQNCECLIGTTRFVMQNFTDEL